ncbi:MAG TPA: DUF2075 domain-containing protein, partial [Thermosulfidibacter takaii]|nr:DUF2075 domain-containing protein [Thermosulfidibacter takaii]
MHEIKTGCFLESPLWNEQVRVISVSHLGNKVKLETVGTATQNYQSIILTPEDLAKISVVQGLSLDFTGDALGHFLTIEAHRIRNAYQFDPLFAVSVSQVDPLPHQIEAVYHYILRNPRIRFLLADDPGAGKTIMAGLLIKELKYRGLVDRILILVPGHLKDQWKREMRDKFQEKLEEVNRATINASWGQNVWKEKNQVITSLDFARQDDVKESLREAQWDLVIVDEAHKLSAYRYGEKVKKT